MKSDQTLLNIFHLCSDKHCFVYEKMPDYFGHELTLGEVEYWVAYNLMTSAEMYGIDYSKLSFSETVEKVRSQRRKREEQIKSWGTKPKKKLA